jgi:hypothetical protein
MGRLADQDGGPEGKPNMKNLSLDPRGFLQLVSRLLSTVHRSETRRPSHGFFSDLIS